ncbi:5'-methylthioadenosine/S-adenosylhomocysteine nucleosidase [Fructobacillus pseudoficulneus]|uniref:5'-methylthioadenosine/S-adenosylhomocysteine nucleosidase n=1 Tax=Fructobacillus pseudoficulneus TaxID=220714 RepID=A0A3F3H6U5_9LACO|nr:hypothetical protein [Fructobacillus pseudoficulneus]GAP02253.1 5'-methylthioadenosine/S-adenosylhomocysteine nucleosidase [Fructobacillus pseudoficulneus]SEH36204.1 hypothetical protein SAMN05660469_0204 [Fructobacillus pseudoficulneus]
MAENNFFTRSRQSREEKKRAKLRQQVEKEYAKEHPDEITVVQPENRAEMRLTKKGRFELGSDGQLTEKGRTDRLAYRYNRGMIFVALLIVATYLFFFFVNFN